MKKLLLFIGLVMLMMMPLVSAGQDVFIYVNTTTSNNWMYGPVYTPNFDQVDISILGGNKTSVNQVAIFNATGSNTSIETRLLAYQGFANYSGEMRSDFNSTLKLLKGGQYYILVGTNDSVSRPVSFQMLGGFPITNQTGGNFTNATFSYSTGTIAVYSQTQKFGLYAINYTASNVVGANATISAYNFYTNTSLTNFTAYITNGSVQINQTTTNGTIQTIIPTNSSYLWNITLESNESGGYFNETYTSVNVSSNVNKSMAQNTYSFYAVEKVTGNNLTGFNFSSVRGTTTYAINQTQYLSNGTYTINSSKTGYYSIGVPITATNYFNSTQNISGVYNQSLNLTVNYLLNLSSVTAFTVTISNSTYNFSESYNVTGNQINLNLTSNIIYNILVNVTNTFGNSTTFNSTLNQSNLTVYVASTTQVNVFFYDEETLLAVNNVNYTVIGATYSLNGSTTTTSNNINFTALNSDSYEIRYTQNGGNYTYRSYFVSIPLTNATTSNLSLYMLKVNSSTTFTLYVTDKYDLPQPNLTVSLLRRYPINGQTVYYIVEQMQPSYALDGQTQFSGVANNVAYLFRVVNDAGVVVFQGSGSTANNLQTLYLISNPIYIRVTLDTNPFTVAQDLEGVSSNLSNTSTQFWFNVQDTSNVLSEVCLKVIGNTSIQVYDFCSTDTSTILSYTATNGNNLSYYTAYGYVVINGVQRVLDSAQIDYRTGQGFRIYGSFGLFLALISIIVVSVAFADKPMFMVIGIALTLLALGSQVFGFIWLSPTLQATVLVLAIMVAYIMRND